MPNADRLEHDAPKLTDFGDNIMLQIVDFDHVYDFGLIQSKIIVIYEISARYGALKGTGNV